MQYTVYTKKKIIILPVAFKCECCGEYNVVDNPFLIEASYNSKGVFTKKGLEKREERANEELESKQNALFQEITEKTNEKNVKNTGYICVCPNCKTVPKWSQFRNKKLDKVVNVIGCIALLIAAYFCLLVLQGKYSNLNNFLVPAVMFAVVFIPQQVIYASKTFKVKGLSEEYMPILCKNREKAKKAFEKFGKDIQEKST